MRIFDYITAGRAKISAGLLGAQKPANNIRQVVQTGPIHGQGISPHIHVIPRPPIHIARGPARYSQ